MSIRVRLTLWYTILVTAVVLIFGVALYYLLTYSLLSNIDRQLAATASRIVESSRLRMSPFALTVSVEVPELDMFATPGLYIQVYDVDSQQTFRSRTLGEGSVPLDDNVLAMTMAGETDTQTIRVGGSTLRLHSAPLLIKDRPEGVVQVATSLAQVDQTKRQLLGILVAGGAIAVVVAAGMATLLARAALRPIDAITQTALSISRTEDLSQRLDVSGPADEVGRLAATFNEMLARLQTLFVTQQRFIADVSHELRTPLTIIQGNSDILRRCVDSNGEDVEETLTAMEEEVARMSRLVADLLLLARADAGIQLEIRPVEMDTLLLQVYRQAKVMSSHVEVRLGHEDQAVVLGDADRLRQLVLNLVQNAIKYTPPGGQVTLSLYREADHVRIIVTDTGIGIPAEALEPGTHGYPRVFERFYRSDRARSRQQGGTGLGLSIAYWIAQAHGGKISVESKQKEGSTFTVWLPSHNDSG